MANGIRPKVKAREGRVSGCGRVWREGSSIKFGQDSLHLFRGSVHTCSLFADIDFMIQKIERLFTTGNKYPRHCLSFVNDEIHMHRDRWFNCLSSYIANALQFFILILRSLAVNPYNFSLIVNAKKDRSAVGIGKCRYRFL